jgi:hypothetical protein
MSQQQNNGGPIVGIILLLMFVAWPVYSCTRPKPKPSCAATLAQLSGEGVLGHEYRQLQQVCKDVGR